MFQGNIQLFKTIQEGINAASYGDTVLVGPATYDASTGEQFPIVMKSGIVLTSELGPEMTVIDALLTDGVIECVNVDSTTVINGFTIKGGHADYPRGGGITCNNSSPVISSNIIERNFTKHGGGGIRLMNYSSPLIIGNTITFNSAINGGGIQVEYRCSPIITNNVIYENYSLPGDGGGIKVWSYGTASPQIVNNIIKDNDAYDKGGGIHYWVEHKATGRISNNLIIGNSAFGADVGFSCMGPGGGIFVSGGSFVTIVNNTITDNYAESPLSDTVAAGIGCYESSWWGDAPIIQNNIISSNRNGLGVYCKNSCDPDISYNNVWNNEQGDYLGCSPGEGDISEDPLFVTGPEGEYYLSQTAAGDSADSPCVDAGSDLASNWGLDSLTTRRDGIPDDGIVDMGYHYQTDFWTVVGEELSDQDLVPMSFELLQNYPNPFNYQTTIRYALPVQSEKLKVQSEGKGTFNFEPSTSYVTLKIYNILGQEIRILVDGEKEAGYYTVTWDGRDRNGIEVSSGVYFCRLQAGDFLKTRKILLLR